MINQLICYFQPSYNNIVMDRKYKSRVNFVDESALAKSAAWAWFQQGSSSGQSVPEFDVSRMKPESNPSRYKLEALKNVQKLALKSPEIKLSSPRSSNGSLFDNYEIERISRQLDHYIESSHAKQRGHGSGESTVMVPAADGAAANVTTKNKVVRKKKTKLGIFRLRHVPACGSSSDDVVEYSRRP
ncbi:hypothetical protein CASFOL_042569 [Castilleja foliolosa]|uniref:Uncharacterized protein n=1 Tax=Castilleja foliolosa TaxID=1961234 RepID=A0ABD3B834_9LAMI